jgi:2,3-diketo-5-methylthio-1-phosphopentane phosphatase
VTTTAILLDIEGATTPIQFVHQVLFPYAATSAAEFLAAHVQEPEVQRACDAILKDATPSELALSGQEAVLAVVRRQMAADVKATGLKLLQGLIWRYGYESGTLRGQIFDDVPVCLRRWHEAGRAVAIYSSGSKLAQQLLFRYSTAGDLTPYLSGYYDTTVGPKRESSSYIRIAQDWGKQPASILFCSDIPEECTAATAAGLQALVVMRPGNSPLPPNIPFPIHADLTRV